MAVLLYNLRDVPDDELEAMRVLLADAGVDFYETRPSLWGVSSGALWLPDDRDLARAAALLDAFHAGRAEAAREDAARAPRPWWTPWRERPLQALAAAIGIVLMLVLGAWPFLAWGA